MIPFSWKERAAIIIFALVALASFALPSLAGTDAAPPYTGDPATTETNALGGFGRTESWTVSVGNPTVQDIARNAVIPAAIRPIVEPIAIVNATRTYTFTMLSSGGSAAATDALCVRAGPSSDDGTFTCGNLTSSGSSTGGCMLFAAGQSCQITVRPPVSCKTVSTNTTAQNYDLCHIPMWGVASASSFVVNVGVAW